MTNPKATSFEIQVLNDKHWVIADTATDETQAKAFADNLLQSGNHAAVRVVRDYRRIDGLHKETVIHEKKASERGPADPTLVSVSEAPLCRELADFYAPAARQTMGRMLRKYLDEVVITPTELLHSAQELKRFGDKGSLLYSAIDRLSTLQARQDGEDGKQRKDFLGRCWDQIVQRARAVQAKKLAAPKTFAEVARLAAGCAPDCAPDERDHLALSAMALKLLDTRSWLGKLDLLCEWAAEPEAADHLPLIDGVVADIVVSSQVIQDLLGYQPNLGAALCHILDLAEGKAEAAKFAPATFTALNRLFAEGRLPQARGVLLARVTREVGGTNPLSRNEPKLEYESFHKVLHRLVGHQGVVGGPAAAEALAARGGRMFSAGGGSGAALDYILSALADACHKLQYLVALAEAPGAQSAGAAPAEVLAGMVRKLDHIDGWVPVRVSPRDRMAALTAANKALKGSAALAEPVRGELANRLDEALARYLLDEGVIEKIDKPDDPLAMRAIRLIKFCGSGVLIDGKSLQLARQRVVDHLRQPQFEEKFLASVPDPVQAEKHLREFHRLLLEGGFRS